MTRTALEGLGGKLHSADEVVIEATGNAMAVSRVLSPFVQRVVIANPLQVKAIAHAHVKTDKVDAGTPASLFAAGYLPEIWTPDAQTERKRRLTARRYQVVRHRTRIKNEVHAILHSHLVPKRPRSDLFTRPGREWLKRQALPDDEREAIDRHLRELDRRAEDLAVLDREIAVAALDGRETANDDHRRQSDGGDRRHVGDRRHSPVRESWEARKLFRIEPSGSAIRARRRSSWPHQQGRA